MWICVTMVILPVYIFGTIRNKYLDGGDEYGKTAYFDLGWYCSCDSGRVHYLLQSVR